MIYDKMTTTFESSFPLQQKCEKFIDLKKHDWLKILK